MGGGGGGGGGGSFIPPAFSCTLIYLALLPVSSKGMPWCIQIGMLFMSLFTAIVVVSLIKLINFTVHIVIHQFFIDTIHQWEFLTDRCQMQVTVVESMWLLGRWGGGRMCVFCQWPIHCFMHSELCIKICSFYHSIIKDVGLPKCSCSYWVSVSWCCFETRKC
jgi:hypothetical protein